MFGIHYGPNKRCNNSPATGRAAGEKQKQDAIRGPPPPVSKSRRAENDDGTVVCVKRSAAREITERWRAGNKTTEQLKAVSQCQGLQMLEQFRIAHPLLEPI